MHELGITRVVHCLIHGLLVVLEQVLAIVIEEILFFVHKLGVNLGDDTLGAADKAIGQLLEDLGHHVGDSFMLVLQLLALLLSSWGSIFLLLKFNLNLLESDQNLLHEIPFKLVTHLGEEILSWDVKLGLWNIKLTDLSKLLLHLKSVQVIKNELETSESFFHHGHFLVLKDLLAHNERRRQVLQVE